MDIVDTMKMRDMVLLQEMMRLWTRVEVSAVGLLLIIIMSSARLISFHSNARAHSDGFDYYYCY